MSVVVLRFIIFSQNRFRQNGRGDLHYTRTLALRHGVISLLLLPRTLGVSRSRTLSLVSNTKRGIDFQLWTTGMTAWRAESAVFPSFIEGRSLLCIRWFRWWWGIELRTGFWLDNRRLINSFAIWISEGWVGFGVGCSFWWICDVETQMQCVA